MSVLDYHLVEKRILRLFVVHHRTTPPRSPLSRRVYVLHFPSSRRCQMHRSGNAFESRQSIGEDIQMYQCYEGSDCNWGHLVCYRQLASWLVVGDIDPCSSDHQPLLKAISKKVKTVLKQSKKWNVIMITGKKSWLSIFLSRINQCPLVITEHSSGDTGWQWIAWKPFSMH